MVPAPLTDQAKAFIFGGNFEVVFQGDGIVPAGNQWIRTLAGFNGTAILPLVGAYGGTLANMADAGASKALLSWLQNLDEGAAPLTYDYVVKTRSNTLLQVWQSALDPAVPFRSEKNREAIRTGLQAYRQNRGSSL